jgi:hypothetical protein
MIDFTSGDWEIERLRDWEIERLRDWEIERLRDCFGSRFIELNRKYKYWRLRDLDRTKSDICFLIGLNIGMLYCSVLFCVILCYSVQGCAKLCKTLQNYAKLCKAVVWCSVLCWTRHTASRQSMQHIACSI